MRPKRYGEVVRRLGKAGTEIQVRSFMEPARVMPAPGINVWQVLRARMFQLAHADVHGDPSFGMNLEQARSHFVAQHHLLHHYTVRNNLDRDVMKEILLPPPEILNRKPAPRVENSLLKGLPDLDGPVAVVCPRPDRDRRDLKVDELKVQVYDQLDVKQMVGVAMPMAYIPIGVLIHGIEMRPGQGAKLVRAKGCYARITKKNPDKPRVAVKMPSGEEKIFDSRCRAVVGPLKAPDLPRVKLYKAGQNRWRGIRPHVRGIAKNPVDHPHGGRTNGGRPSCTPWGKPCKCGYKTVRKPKLGLKFY